MAALLRYNWSKPSLVATPDLLIATTDKTIMSGITQKLMTSSRDAIL